MASAQFDATSGRIVSCDYLTQNTVQRKAKTIPPRAWGEPVAGVWPDVRILIRADAGFAVPEVYIGCETLRLEYTIGLGMNSVLKRRSETLLEKALKDFTEKAEPQRQFDAFEYQAATWSEPRWVVLRAAANAQGTNRRAVVTNRSGARVLPEATYGD